MAENNSVCLWKDMSEVGSQNSLEKTFHIPIIRDR